MTLAKGGYAGSVGWIAPLVLMLAIVGMVVRTLLAEERRR